MTEYRHNHYVPVWYQKRFLPPGQKDKELFRLDLRPGFIVDRRGNVIRRKDVRRRGFKHCFGEENLYTFTLAGAASSEIERLFFGAIDSNGKAAVDYFTDFGHPFPAGGHEALEPMLLYMSTQKLRTPKGLLFLMWRVHGLDPDRDTILGMMVSLRNLYSAIWAECTWQIADATQSIHGVP